MKIIDTIWFSGHTGDYGIVMIDNGYETKAYIGNAFGHDEEADAKRIAEGGAPIYKQQALLLLKHLKSHAKEENR